MTSFSCRCCVTLLSIAAAMDAGAQTDDTSITVRLRPLGPGDPARKGLWSELLRISKPVELHIGAGESVRNAIARQCGSAPQDLIDFTSGLNPDKGGSVSDVARTWRFFPCPFWKFSAPGKPVTVPVSKGQALGDILRFNMGDSGPRTVAAVRQLNQGTIDSTGTIAKDTELRLPYLIKSKTIGLDASLIGKPDEAIDTVTAAVPALAKDPVLQKILPTTTLAYKLVAEDYPATNGNSTCAGPGEGEAWPFDMNAVLALLEQEKAVNQLRGLESVVLVADTGLDASVRQSGMLWVNRRVDKGQGSITDFNGDLNGANLVDNNGDISPSADYPLALHGTEVFSVLSGGMPDPAKMGIHLVVAGAKIVTNTPPYRIDRAALHDSFRYATQIARQNPSVILNLSAVSTGQINGLADAMRATELLVVAAAGNNYDRVDSLDIYPPAFHDYREKLIVVGAHDWANNIADFSNRGMLVDLLAPGCKLKIRDPAGKFISVSGTSFSAPLVSLTAAMLSSLGLKHWEIKNRILSSVDYDSRLVNVVSTGGRLNILNALRVHTDILELRDPQTKRVTTHFGKIERNTTWICRTAATSILYRPAQMARLVLHDPGTVRSQVRIYTNPGSPGNRLEQPSCDSVGGELRFVENGQDVPQHVEWAHVASIIFSMP